MVIITPQFKTPRKPASSKKNPDLFADQKLSTVKWIDNGKRLNDFFIIVFEENKFIKRVIWPVSDDHTVEIKKSVVYRFLVNVLFTDFPLFDGFMKYK